MLLETHIILFCRRSQQLQEYISHPPLWQVELDTVRRLRLTNFGWCIPDAPAWNRTVWPFVRFPTKKHACIAVNQTSGTPAAAIQLISFGLWRIIFTLTAIYSAYAPPYARPNTSSPFLKSLATINLDRRLADNGVKVVLRPRRILHQGWVLPEAEEDILHSVGLYPFYSSQRL